MKKKFYDEFKFRKNFNGGKVLKEDFLDSYNELLDSNSNSVISLGNLTGNYLYIPEKIKKGKNDYVLIIIHELSRTGAPVVAFDTAKLLVENDYNVLIATIKSGDLLEEINQYGIPVLILNEIRYFQFMNNDLDCFKSNYDLDFFVKFFDKKIIITATLYQLIKRYMNRSKNIYWWIHEGSASYDILGDRMPKKISKNIKVFCGGQYSANQLKKYGFDYNQKVLNYGVTDIIKYNLQKRKNNCTFLLAGTIGERKGQRVLLQAIKKIKEKYLKKCEFIFIGDICEGDINASKIKDELIEYSKQNNNVKIYSSIPRNELYEIYKKIDVLVVASTDDPMPVVATENMMFGNIVLCSTNTGTSYYIKNKINGFVFETNNVNSLAENIEYIIKNTDELQNIRKQSRMIFENEFEMKIFKKNLFNLVMGDKNE